VHRERERAIFGEKTPFYGWLYPPFFLFVAAGLALMSYPVALAVRQGVSLLLFSCRSGRSCGATLRPAARHRQDKKRYQTSCGCC
jgi:hypothetical protein